MARFFRRGVSKVVFAPVVASAAAPTRAEITAGSDLTAFVADINGFNISNDPIPTPVLSSKFTPSIEGEDTTDASSLVLYDDSGTAPAFRAACAKGTAGYLILMPYGDTAAKRCEVWPVVSTGVNDEWSMGNDPARTTVGFSITNPPTQNAVVPAAT